MHEPGSQACCGRYAILYASYTMLNTALLHAVRCPRILLVEDNPIQARLLTTLVRQMGLCPVGPVATAAEALALCHQQWPELAILDVNLAGELDGIELAMHLGLLGHLPLVFLSGTDDDQILARIDLAQPLAFLPKPYQPEALQRIIAQGLALGSGRHPHVVPLSFEPQLAGATLFVRESNVLVRLEVADIVCVQAVQQHAVLTLASGRRYSVRLSLADVLRQLPATDFVQCHRAWAVSLPHIRQVELSADRLHLTGGIEAHMGRAYRHNVQQHLHVLG